MKTLKFLLPITLFVLILASCGKEDPVVSPETDIDQLFTQFKADKKIQMDGAQIDALLIADYGYAEQNDEQRAELLFASVNERIPALFADEMATETATARDCNAIQTSSNVSEGGASFRGVTCEQNLLLKSLVIGRFANGVEIFQGDVELFFPAFESIETAFEKEFGPDGVTLDFGAAEGSISTLDGSVGNIIVGHQFTRSNLFCDPDDFGDGLRLQSQTRVFRGTQGDGIVDYSISLSIICKD